MTAEQPLFGIQDSYTLFGGTGGFTGTAAKCETIGNFLCFMSNIDLLKEVPQPYNFDYQSADEQGNTHYHREEADASGTVRGSYGYTDVQGLYRVVDYIADVNGFRASIRTNEPGTDGKESPADVQMTVEQPPFGIQDRYTPFGLTGGSKGTFGGGAGGYGCSVADCYKTGEKGTDEESDEHK
ncbi:hypothetical protein AVEN_13523-1 [Araneus ventricosus]|uniref:Cuticle protein 10.9 n=1 Tax=Araneus ventricosus TaxID=182803 RepID=A0A4Y2LLQ8_ARAVE|nr:hypothetical protein AVEN_13523-1 [Araneus ventricosus]